ncbi:MAG: Hsp20/alpha crystallin family protein [Erysipelotrichaceae bacterium]
MSLLPKRLGWDTFDSLFDDPFFRRPRHFEVMKTDIKESDAGYQLDIDLPGYRKEDIHVDVENGYLTISAERQSSNETREGETLIRQERYYGKCQRSYYVGEKVKREDIKAKLQEGILTITLPKVEAKAIEEKASIPIE